MSVKNWIYASLDFVTYVESFYGPVGVYPMGATTEQIVEATKKLVNRYGEDTEFDSIDRERVRDIMIEDFGLVFPQPGTPCNGHEDRNDDDTQTSQQTAETVVSSRSPSQS